MFPPFPDKRDLERLAKRSVFFDAYDRGGVVRLHLDARKEMVNVPPQFLKTYNLCLEYGKNLPIPAEEQNIIETGIYATLSFNRQQHRTFVPWDAVFGITASDYPGLIFWKDDAPPEFSLDVPVVEPAGLKLVSGDEVPDENTPAPKYTGPPVLRLVK